MTDTSTRSRAHRGSDRYSAAARRPIALLWWGLGLVVFVVAFGLTLKLTGTLGTIPEGDGKTGEAVVSTWTQGLDTWWAALVSGNEATFHSPLGVVFEYLLGGIGGTVTSLVVAIVLLALRHWRSAIVVFFTPFVATMLATFILKPLVDRARPWQVDPNRFPQLADNDPGSFPSGHCTTAAAILVVVIAVMLAAWRKWAIVVAALLMIGTIWQRTMSNSHWLTDTLAGAAFGAACALIVWFALFGWIRKDFAPRHPAAVAE